MPTSPLDFLKALVVLLAAATAYDRAAAPLMIGRTHVDEIPIRPLSNQADETLASYFRPGAWQTDNPMQIEMEMGVLLFKKWERKTDTRWKLSPVTLLLRGDADEDSKVKVRRPILLEAPGGAEIEFAESLEVIDGDTPPVTGGHLIGRVQLIGPATKQDGSDRLQIDASDVRINGKKIWTTAPVRVQFGTAVAEGRDLTITLAGGGNLNQEQAGSPLSILNNLSLIYLDRLQMPLQTKSLWEPLPEVAKAHPGAAARGGQGMLHVRCGGALRFDFTTYTLSLNDHVSIEHAGVGLPVDRLECPTLTIELEDPFGKSVANPTPDRVIRRIRAFGGPVLIDAPTLLSRAKAELVEADFRSGKIEITGSQAIQLTHRALQLQMRNLQYRFVPGKITDMIQVKAGGDGYLVAQDPELPLRTFQWKEQLRITPEREPNKYQLWLLKAAATLADQGKIKTDDLRFGFYFLPADQVGPAVNKAGPMGGRFRPENIVAKGNVLFDTKDVLAETDELDLFIEQVPTGSKDLALNSPEGNRLRLWAREPAEPATVGNTDPRGANAPVKSRPRLKGRRLSAYVKTDGVDAVAREFRIDQGIRLEHVLQSEQGPMLVVLTGNNLIYVDGEQGQVVQVSGAPAQVEVADGYFRGPMVQLRISENILYMDRAGEFQVPLSMVRSTVQASPAQQFRWVTPPICRWQGRMHFNGHVARLIDGITLQGAVTTLEDPSRWDVHVGCDLVEITLRDRIDFADPQGAGGSGDIQQIAFKGRDANGSVLLSAVQRTLGGKLMGSHQMNVPSIDLIPDQGKLLGSGPGWYHMWTKPEIAQGSPLSALTESGGWHAVHLVYQEAIDGDMNSKRLSFIRGVRVATSPVANEQQRIDANRIVQAQLGQGLLDCDRLDLSQTPAGHQFNRAGQSFGAWEARAVSNVSFQGRSEKGFFRGTAERLSYAADKDLFVVEGLKNRPAEFMRQYDDGTPGGRLKAYSLRFKPRTFELSQLRLHSLDMGDLERGFGVPKQPLPQAATPSNAPRF